MADSNITVSALSITPGIGHNLARVTYSDPNADGLQSLKIDKVELWAASSNDRAGAAKVGEGLDNIAHMGLVEGASYYYWTKARNNAGFYGDWYPAGATSGVIGTVGFAAGAAQALINGKITATVAANAVTIRVKTLSGDDPSATNPVFVGFRPTDGGYVVRSITAALSLTISSGSTMGVVSSSRCARLWLVAFDDAGTVRLAAINLSLDGAVLALSEVGVANATAEGSSGGADTLGVFYASVSISAKQFRIIGYLEWSTPIATAGQYANAPDLIHLAGPLTKLPGDIVQMRVSGSAQHASGVSTIPFDDTPPLNSEGTLLCSAAITPTSPCNAIVVDALAVASRSNAGPITAAVIETSGLTGPFAFAMHVAAADQMAAIAIKSASPLNDVTARTFNLRIGADGGATLYTNGTSAGRRLGGATVSYLGIVEVMG